MVLGHIVVGKLGRHRQLEQNVPFLGRVKLGVCMANISERNGNIFDSSCQTIVNTVNCVGVMGRGIAFEFKHRFPEMFAAYKKVCDDHQLTPGKLLLWTQTNPWVLNFPTKKDWKHPSKLEFIEAGLVKFAGSYAQKQISSVAFPLLGTSNGGLQWDDVGPLMYRHLEPLKNLDVEIYHFDPNAKDNLFEKLRQRVNRFEVTDFVEIIGVTKPQAKIFMDAIEKASCRRMTDLAKIKGIGPKAFDKIFEFANAESASIATKSDAQLRLI